MDKIIKGQPVPPDDISSLKEFTTARIAIGRTGVSMPATQALELKLAHAHARDAVYSKLNVDALAELIAGFEMNYLLLHSKAEYREQYLQRPDYGRQLNEESVELVAENKGDFDVAIIIADGLSAAAINENAGKLLNALLPLLNQSGLKMAPVCLVKEGRVAIGDEIGGLLNAKISIMLIGERPGLSSADSIGAYITYKPKPGLTDDARNCVSNIRLHGLKFKTAAEKIFYIVQEALKRKLSGVGLKDNSALLNC